MKTRPALLAMAAEECPRCRKQKLFKSSAFNLRRFSEMHDDCPACGCHFEVEPGFFWGAMYFSYAINVAIMLITAGFMYFILDVENPWIYIGVISGLVILLIPFLFRYSRVLMLYAFSGIRYEPDAAKPTDISGVRQASQKTPGAREFHSVGS